MKKNGFAIAGILYPLLVLFLCFLLLALAQMTAIKFRYDKIKEEIQNAIDGARLNSDVPTFQYKEEISMIERKISENVGEVH